MNRRGPTALLVAWLAARLVTLASGWAAAAPPDWRGLTPDGWLAALVVEDPGESSEAVRQFVEPLGLRSPALGPLLAGLAPAELIASRPWVAFLVATGKDAPPEPLLLIPTDRPDSLCEAFGAQRAEDLLIGSIAGYEVALRPSPGWLVLAPLDGALAQAGAVSASPAPRLDASLGLSVSPAGTRWLADRLTKPEPPPAPQRSTRRQAIAVGLRSKLASWSPLARAVADLDACVSIALDSDANEYTLDLLLPGENADLADLSAPNPDRDVAAAEGSAIGWLRWRSAWPESVRRLALAFARCGPKIVEARVFPTDSWRDFAASADDLIRATLAGRVALHSPARGAPVASNLALTIDTGPEDLLDRLDTVASRWNTLLESALAASPLAVEPAADGAPRGGRRYTVDLVEAFGVDRSPEVLSLLKRYYGPDGRLRIDCEPRSGGGWTIRSPDAQPAQPAATSTLSYSNNSIAVGEFHVDRWLAWQDRLAAAEAGDASLAKTPSRLGLATERPPPATIAVRVLSAGPAAERDAPPRTTSPRTISISATISRTAWAAYAESQRDPFGDW